MPPGTTGYELLQTGTAVGATGQSMVCRPGPAFANLVLADEINGPARLGVHDCCRQGAHAPHESYRADD